MTNKMEIVKWTAAEANGRDRPKRPFACFGRSRSLGHAKTTESEASAEASVYTEASVKYRSFCKKPKLLLGKSEIFVFLLPKLKLLPPKASVFAEASVFFAEASVFLQKLRYKLW